MQFSDVLALLLESVLANALGETKNDQLACACRLLSVSEGLEPNPPKSKGAKSALSLSLFGSLAPAFLVAVEDSDFAWSN